LPKYRAHNIFLDTIDHAQPVLNNDGYLALNENFEPSVGFIMSADIYVGNPKSREVRLFIPKHKLVELRGILDAAIFDLYEGQDMSNIFDSDLTN
jgi:hypothetical protein